MSLPIGIAAGIALGVFFYGGLWMTVRQIPRSRHPAPLVFGSLLVRMAVVLAGFVLLSHGQWRNAVALLAGLIAGRMAVSRYLTLCA